MLIGVDASRVTRPQRTGTENYSLHVLQNLLARESPHGYRLYLSQPLPAKLLPEGPHITTRLIRLPRLWTQVGLSREMAVAPPDVLFVPSHVLPLVSPSRNVVVVYDVGHRFFPRAHGVLEWLYAEWAIRRHVRLATGLVTISQASKRDLVQLYRADPTRIAVAYPAVDEHFRPASAEQIARVRQRYGLGDRYVLHVGTLKPRKNLPRLVRAFATTRLPVDTQLVLAGSGPVDRTLVTDRVRLLSYVPVEDLPALYSGAAAVAIVSLYEGFGMPALEALACGAPLVASNRGSLPEVAAGAAVLVDPLDVTSIAHGLERAVNDPRLAAELRVAGLERARDYSWSEAARVTAELIDRAGATGPADRTPPRAPRSFGPS